MVVHLSIFFVGHHRWGEHDGRAAEQRLLGGGVLGVLRSLDVFFNKLLFFDLCFWYLKTSTRLKLYLCFGGLVFHDVACCLMMCLIRSRGFHAFCFCPWWKPRSTAAVGWFLHWKQRPDPADFGLGSRFRHRQDAFFFRPCVKHGRRFKSEDPKKRSLTILALMLSRRKNI